MGMETRDQASNIAFLVWYEFFLYRVSPYPKRIMCPPFFLLGSGATFITLGCLATKQK